MKKLSSIALALLFAAACESSGSSGPIGTYEISTGEQNLASIPFPSDTLRDANGHIPLSTLNVDSASPNQPDMLDDLKTEQDGFGATSGAFFPVGRFVAGAVGTMADDPKTGTVDATTLDGNVHLYPLSCPDGSITASTPEIPVITHLRAMDHPQRIYARQEQGIVLQQNCTYGYVITNGVKTSKGALGPSDDMAALMSAKTPAARLSAAYTIFAPLRARLASGTVTTTDVASATVFTVHSLTPDYLAARTLITATKPVATVQYVFARTVTAANAGSLDDLFGVAAMEQPGEDNPCTTTPMKGIPGCQAHGNIDYVVQGTFQTVDFLGGSTKNPMGIDGTAVGQLAHAGTTVMSKGMVSVPFTMVIPSGADLTKPLRLTVVQHGLGADRTSMLTVSNTLAGRGIASVLLDLPFHGARCVDAEDKIINLTGAAGSDGFGETTTSPDLGFFDAFGNVPASIPSANPRAIRSAFFQATNDIEQEFNLVNAGDISAIATKEPRLAGLSFDTAHETYVGESFGSMIGTIVTAFQPNLVASVLDVGGGGTIFPLLINSATFAPAFDVLLDAQIGTLGANDEDTGDTDWGYNLAQWMLEEGDALAYSPYGVAKQAFPGDVACHVLQISAYRDELVPNQANLALARGLGLQPLTLVEGPAPDLTGWPEATPATGMLSGNDGGQTAVFIQFRPAIHELLTTRNGFQNWDLSTPVPYSPLSPPTPVADPIDRVNSIVRSFVDTASLGMTPIVK